MILLVIASLFLCHVLGYHVPIQTFERENQLNISQPIIGDTVHRIREHPWLVSIETNSGHFCGGSILSESVILTTGICASTFSPKRKLIVRAGSSTINSGGSTHEVVTKVIHENFKGVYGHFEGNLAMMRVSPPFQFGSSINKVQLLNPRDIIISGLIGSGGINVNIFGHSMKKMRLRIVDIAKCARQFETELYGHICASATSTTHRPDNCLYSGDPVIDKGVLFGITSFYGCVELDRPEIYVNIFYHLSWIKKNLQNLETPAVAHPILIKPIIY